jgi:polyribonucleotide nucleotidyltransferase
VNKIKKTFQYGDHAVTLETGTVARQASAAVMVRMGDTVLLVTVVGVADDKGGRDFFPLTINYQEKFYAAGVIPGGYLKREARPSDRETLICRLIDRPLRPMFAKGFSNEVQVVVTVMSYDPDVETDIAAIIGASAAVSLSGIPFNGPIGAARVGYIDNEFVLNPASSKLADSKLDLVVSGTEHAVLMVESEAEGLSEDTMLDAVMFGHEQQQVVIKAINEMVEESGRTVWDWTAPAKDHGLIAKVETACSEQLQSAYNIQEKLERKAAVSNVTSQTVAEICVEGSEIDEKSVSDIVHNIESKIVRERVISGGTRIDGRDCTTVRKITIELGILPRAHGSALFTRGETQAIVVTTLGTERDAQKIDSILGDSRVPFMLHYNFPPYCVGEARPMMSPKRREIGHGCLAKRSLAAVVPTEDEFPYVLRVVSEITESNGSSSMASVCGGSLSMMDAGVPLKQPVAGIAMGLIKEGDEFKVLTDILGDEDHLGDMDFKVAGTADGVTALQMDIKIDGITREIMQQALAQAKDGRMHILSIMNEALEKPRGDVSAFAPRILTIKINPEKIREVIGKGGATIRALTEETGATIDLDDDGTVKIAAVDGAQAEAAKKRIEEIVAEPEVGHTYDAEIVKIADFGAFARFMPGRDGLVHISQICEERVENVSDHLFEGQKVRVKVLEIDRQGRVRLSMKEAE